MAQVSPDPVAILGFFQKNQIQDVGPGIFANGIFCRKKCDIKKTNDFS